MLALLVGFDEVIKDVSVNRVASITTGNALSVATEDAFKPFIEQFVRRRRCSTNFLFNYLLRSERASIAEILLVTE